MKKMTDFKKKARFSLEYTMLSILEYMCTGSLEISVTGPQFRIRQFMEGRLPLAHTA